MSADSQIRKNSKFRIGFVDSNQFAVLHRSGQSLIEILISLAIGAILIGTAAIGVAFMLKSTSTNQNLQSGGSLVQELSDKIRSFAGADWQNINSLTKGTGTQYFLNASSAVLVAVQGKEGVLDNDVSNGLVGRWNFDEAAGTIAYDSAGNNYGGTLRNSPTRTASACKAGYCLSFNGTDNYVEVSDPASGALDPTTQYSLSLWVKTTSTAAYAFVISKSNGGSGGGYELYFADGKVGFSSCDSLGVCSGGYFNTTTTLSYNDNNWHHVAATAQTNSTAKIYVDGSLVKESGTITQDNIANSLNLIIGGRGTGGGNPISGVLDDIRVYNRALSASEAKRIHNSGVYTRFFTIENVCRSNDASSTVTGVEPCADGSFLDPSTQKATSNVQWSISAASGTVSIVDYMTRWQNNVFRQTNWSGGIGAEEPVTEVGDTYSTSTNVDVNSGSIRLHGL